MLDWTTNFINDNGYVAVAVLMLAENVFPPIPSELVMPLAGYSAARGDVDLAGVTLAGIVGSLLGALFWYLIGRWISTDRLRNWAAKHGRLLTLSPADVGKADAWFDRHGAKAVFLGRLVPGLRTLISVPAGVSEMPLPRFLLYSTLGTAIWTTLLTVAGYGLGERYQAVGDWINPVGTLVIAALVVGYVYRVATFDGNR